MICEQSKVCMDSNHAKLGLSADEIQTTSEPRLRYEYSIMSDDEVYHIGKFRVKFTQD